MERKSPNYPPRIESALRGKGYFSSTVEERKKCGRELQKQLKIFRENNAGLFKMCPVDRGDDD